MAQNVTVAGASYSDVPAVQLPKTGGGTATFYDADFNTVTQTLTSVTSSADETRVETGNSFYAELAPTLNNYVISSITVTMGGVDITDQVFKPGTGAKAITANGTYYASSDNLSGYSSVVVSVPGGSTLGTKSISSNGTYNASSDSLDGYSQVTVSVPTGTARSSSDLEVSGDTVTAPAGLYASSVSKSVASGTAGTPTATKGTVSNHSISVTPSVTNTTGYITGSTKTGTAVTVSASELASGNKSITANGTDIDVVGYSTVSVSVSGTSKNAQVVQSTTRTNSSTMTALSAELTVSKTGTYDIYYSATRTNTSSSYTWATQLYKDGTAQGTENTTWSNNVQNVRLTNQSLTANQKLRVYGRQTRGSSYYVCVPMLAIVES